MKVPHACPQPIATSSVVVLAMLLSGCAMVQPVQPWEKGDLARPAMGFEVDRVDAAFVEHT